MHPRQDRYHFYVPFFLRLESLWWYIGN